MRKLATILVLLFVYATGFAQKTTTTKNNSIISKPSRDALMLQFTYENWLNKPDTVKVTGFGRGFNGYICYDFPIKKSNFSFAAGIGIGTSNIYFDNQELIFTDVDSAANGVRFIPETKDFKKFKLTTAYLEAPFELRFFGNKDNRNKGFKAAIGLRVGTMVGGHTKGRRAVDGTKLVEKVNTRRYMETWRFSGTVRIGWGNVTLLGTYNLNKLFKEDKGPDVTPYSIGICFSGL